MKYRLFSCKTPKELVEMVNRAIEKGWRPIGGASVCVEGKLVIFAQALVKDGAGEEEVDEYIND